MPPICTRTTVPWTGRPNNLTLGLCVPYNKIESGSCSGRILGVSAVVVRDDLGAVFELKQPVRRVISLVPSLTEAVAETDRSLLVGATDWCTHPALDVPRVRGTKNPNVGA